MSTLYEILEQAITDAVELVLEVELDPAQQDALTLHIGETVVDWLDQGFHGSEP